MAITVIRVHDGDRVRALPAGKSARAGVLWRPRPQSLTPAQQRVAALVSAGLTSRQIGAQLGCSPRTVDTHVEHILRRRNLQTRRELAAHVAADPELRLLVPDGPGRVEDRPLGDRDVPPWQVPDCTPTRTPGRPDPARSAG